GERRPSGVADYTDSARKLQPDSSSWWTGLPAGLSCPESWHERRTSGLVQGLLRASPNRVPERRVRVELRRVWRLLRRLRTLLGREPHSRISIQAPRSRRRRLCRARKSRYCRAEGHYCGATGHIVPSLN